jgi:hypothetical protein
VKNSIRWAELSPLNGVYWLKDSNTIYTIIQAKFW